MTFKQYINCLVVEDEDIAMPVLDGTTEVYGMDVNKSPFEDTNNVVVIRPLHRLTSRSELYVWNMFYKHDVVSDNYGSTYYKLLYKGNNAQQALKLYTDIIRHMSQSQSNHATDTSRQQAISMAQKLANMVGIYMILWDTYQNAYLGVQVDTDYYISKHREDTPFKDFNF